MNALYQLEVGLEPRELSEVQHRDERIQVEPLHFGSEPSPVSPTNTPHFRALARTIRQTGPEGVIVAPYLLTGATDARHYLRLTPNTYRFVGATVTPEMLNGVHGTDERVPAAEFRVESCGTAQIPRGRASTARGGVGCYQRDAKNNPPEQERRWIGKGSWLLDRVPLFIRLPRGAHAQRCDHEATRTATASLAGADWSTGSMTTVLAWEPRRARVWLVRAGVAAVTVLDPVQERRALQDRRRRHP